MLADVDRAHDVGSVEEPRRISGGHLQDAKGRQAGPGQLVELLMQGDAGTRRGFTAPVPFRLADTALRAGLLSVTTRCPPGPMAINALVPLGAAADKRDQTCAIDGAPKRSPASAAGLSYAFRAQAAGDVRHSR
jgi:hypothetical protein